ncbi:DUF397 domain-containing protein [Kitasatospora sp. NPDC059827]|uniref:DUF397 domain-containing protein n=1 Tax=Kitasatospora sp. NPDC059827 TaxID=3346964 RepID=UPI003663DF8E
MSEFWNGMPASSIHGVTWVKSKASNIEGQCVEFAKLAEGDVAVRNSRYPEGPVLIYTPGEIKALREGMQNGDFDHMIET